MRYPFLALALALALLAGCTAKTDLMEQGVIGPDLGHSGPFDAVHDVVMTRSNQDSDAPDQRERISIRRADPEDSGEVVNLFSNTSKPFKAGVTYHAFIPIVAETNAEAKAYWLVGFNLTRTPDRSVYMVLRYPKGLDIKPGLTSDAFEYLEIECGDLTVARRPADYYRPVPEGQTREEPAPDPAPEAGDCEFASLAEAYNLTGLALKRYDQIKHYDDAPQPSWQPLHVEMK